MIRTGAEDDKTVTKINFNFSKIGFNFNTPQHPCAMHLFNVNINGSLFCIEEVQLTSLTVMAVPVKDMPKFMGL